MSAIANARLRAYKHNCLAETCLTAVVVSRFTHKKSPLSRAFCMVRQVAKA
jgi:hypothetical protein